MAKGKTRIRQQSNVMWDIATFCILGIVILLLIAAVIAALVHEGRMDEDFVRYFALTALGVCSFLGTTLTSKRDAAKMWITFAGGGAILYLAILCANTAVFGGEYAGLGLGTAVYISGMIIGILLKVVGGKPRKKGSYKYRYR